MGRTDTAGQGHVYAWCVLRSKKWVLGAMWAIRARSLRSYFSKFWTAFYIYCSIVLQHKQFCIFAVVHLLPEAL